MAKSKVWRFVFFGIIALLLLSELFFSNIGSLGNIEEVAQQVGLTVAAERTRLYMLIFFDAVGGLGALWALVTLWRNESLPAGHASVWVTAVGLVGYGLYQFGSAIFQLGADFRVPVMIVGVVYAGLGIAAWATNR